jgi:hypothetical protein
MIELTNLLNQTKELNKVEDDLIRFLYKIYEKLFVNYYDQTKLNRSVFKHETYSRYRARLQIISYDLSQNEKNIYL